MHPLDLHLDQLLRENRAISAAWIDRETNPSTLVILQSPRPGDRLIKLPSAFSALDTDLHTVPPFKILRCPVTQIEAQNENQTCQDEPLALGTQIQPYAANWLGTAGSPVKWLDSQKNPHWGLLSNWHVLADGDPRVGRTCHQPTTARGHIATLAKWSGPVDDETALIDAAIADALVDGRHTIGRQIIGIGDIGPAPLDASVGLAVRKSGRTTGVTRGGCTAVGASVRVGYGDFDALFGDQDVFASESAQFSAAGDSGSLIVDEIDNRPVSLLFAGGGDLTIGNPMRHVAAAFGLVFPFH